MKEGLADPAVDRPKMLADPAARALRACELWKPHMAPLVAFVEDLRTQAPAGIPQFDPWDGGINAEILYLLEAPGPQAVESGFVSRNNPDETAKNLFLLSDEVQIPRQRTIIWNIVPWYIGDGAKIRAANGVDIAAGLKSLGSLFDLLPKLKCVILLGRKAERAATAIAELRPQLPLLRCPHPSPQFINRNVAANRACILAVLRKAAEQLT